MKHGGNKNVLLKIIKQDFNKGEIYHVLGLKYTFDAVSIPISKIIFNFDKMI